MDPKSGVASIITLTTLSKDIVQTCRRYVKDVRDAPIVLSRFCDELETLTVLFDHFLILQQTTSKVPSCQSGVLTEVLRRAHLLKDYECQLRKLEAKIKKVNLRIVGQRLRFPLLEPQILDGLNVVQRIRSILESAMLLDDSFYTQSIHSEVQKLSAALRITHNQVLVDSSRREAKHRETIAIFRDELSHARPTPTSGIAQISERGYLSRQSRSASYQAVTKRILDLSFGRVSVCNENSPESSKFRQTGCKAKRSRVTIAFVPSPMFWQTIILLRLEWAVRLDSLLVPTLSLQFLDVVEDGHPIIRASIRGDCYTLEGAFSSQKGSPLCSTITGWTPLHFAAAYGQLDTCRLLMAQGAPLNATGFRGITPLHLAAHFGRFEIFKALMKAGSDPDDYHEHGMNAILEILSNETVSNSPDLDSFLKWLLHEQEQFLPDTQARDNSERGILYHLAYPPGWANNPTHALTTNQSKTIDLVLRGGTKGDELDVHKLSVLHEACRDGRLDLVELLLSGSCSINARDGRGYTPLHYAVESRNFELVSTLVIHGSDISAIAHRGSPFWGHSTPLNLAAKLNWVEVVAFLIQHGAGDCDEIFSEAFHIAVKADSLETVQYFIENGVDQLDFCKILREAGNNSAMIQILCKAGAPLDENRFGLTPLALAAMRSWDRTAKKLVELGADLDKLSWGLTPLGHAAKYGHGNIVHILLAAGARTELTGDQMSTPWQLATSHGYGEIANNIARHADIGPTCKLVNNLSTDIAKHKIEVEEAPLRVEWDLKSATVKGDLKVVERLLEEGCSLNAGKNSLWSPLSEAIRSRQWSVARKLVENSAELNMSRRDESGFIDIPFMEAVTSGNVALIELMIQHGADVNTRNHKASTPLLQSLDQYLPRGDGVSKPCYRNGEVIRLLLSAGANVNAIDKFGRTSLGKAAYIGNFEAVSALVEAGADLNRPSSQNIAQPMWFVEWEYLTPLTWAARNGHENVVKLLFDSGAEWRSLKKEPALSSTHRLLVRSWFPDDLEAHVDSVSGVELLSVPPGDAIENYDSQSPDHSGNEATPILAKDRGYSASISHYKSKKLYTATVSVVRSLAWWIRELHDRLQLIRIEAVAFTCISLIFLARDSLRYISIPRLIEVKIIVLAMLTGLLMASWINA